MAWRTTVRRGPHVEHARHETLADALDALETRCRSVADGPGLEPVAVARRTFAPAQQVAARCEVAGPRRLLPPVRGGVDVRGDGSTEAWLGRTKRRLIAIERDEDAYAALRRAIGEAASSVNAVP